MGTLLVESRVTPLPKRVDRAPARVANAQPPGAMTIFWTRKRRLARQRAQQLLTGLRAAAAILRTYAAVLVMVRVLLALVAALLARIEARLDDPTDEPWLEAVCRVNVAAVVAQTSAQTRSSAMQRTSSA